MLEFATLNPRFTWSPFPIPEWRLPLAKHQLLLEQNGNALGRGDHDVAHVLNVGRSSDSADRVLLLGVFDATAAEVGVIVRKPPSLLHEV